MANLRWSFLVLLISCYSSRLSLTNLATNEKWSDHANGRQIRRIPEKVAARNTSCSTHKWANDSTFSMFESQSQRQNVHTGVLRPCWRRDRRYFGVHEFD